MRLAILLFTLAIPLQAQTELAPTSHHVTGSFQPSVKIASDPGQPISRLTLTKTIHGGIEGTGAGEMLASGNPASGAAGYVALEVITGTVDGKTGTFALMHSGKIQAGKTTLDVTVVPGSGTGKLTGIAGTFTIHVAADGKHTFDFDYTLPTP